MDWWEIAVGFLLIFALFIVPAIFPEGEHVTAYGVLPFGEEIRTYSSSAGRFYEYAPLPDINEVLRFFADRNCEVIRVIRAKTWMVSADCNGELWSAYPNKDGNALVVFIRPSRTSSS